MKTTAIFALFLTVLSSSWARADDLLVYFGTHVGGAGKGFSVSHFDTQTGVLSPPKFLLEAPAPAYFIFDPSQKFLYACNSTHPDFTDQKSGGVSSYSV